MDSDYNKCILQKRRHDLADDVKPSEECMKKYGVLFGFMDQCYKNYANDFEPGVWHDCEKMSRKNYIRTKVENYLFDKSE